MTMPQPDWTDEDVYLIAERAYGLFQQGLYAEAALILEGLVVIDPENLYCHNALIAAYLNLGRPDDAARQASVLLEQFPDDHDARARRCEAWIQIERWQEAREDLAELERGRATAWSRRMRMRLDAAGGDFPATSSLRFR
jgi:tetratricopeptide (TPR) repeat protein